MLRRLKKLLILSLERRGYYVSFGEPATLDAIFSSLHNQTKDFFFVQIGAYDGKEHDPISQFVHHYRWSGILVEPQPEAFERLKRNYAQCPGLIFENAAIANQDGLLTMYRLKDEFAHLFPVDHHLITSFKADHITKLLSQPVDPGQALEKIEVPSLTLPALFAKHAVKKIDLLQIDAEGYDHEIIKMVDFDRIKPKIIRFEHLNLSAVEKCDCMQTLISHNYRLIVGAYDITAFQSRWMYS